MQKVNTRTNSGFFHVFRRLRKLAMTDPDTLDYKHLYGAMKLFKEEILNLGKHVHRQQVSRNMEDLYLYISSLTYMEAAVSQIFDIGPTPQSLAYLYLMILRKMLSEEISSLRNHLGMSAINLNKENLISGSCKKPEIVYYFDSAELKCRSRDQVNTCTTRNEIISLINLIDSSASQFQNFLDKTFLVVGTFYELSPNRHVTYELVLGTFKLTNVEGFDISFSLPSLEADRLLTILCKEPSNGSQTTSSFEILTAEKSGFADNLSNQILKGSKTLSDYVGVVGDKTAESVTRATPMLMDNMGPNPVEVPTPVIVGTEVVKVMCSAAASVTGFLAGTVMVGLSAASEYLAPHVEKQCTSMMTSWGMKEKDAKEYFSESAKVVGAAVNGFKAVSQGVYDSGTVVANSMASNTVKVVKHVYGEPMSQVAGNTLDAIGNLAVTSSNMQFLTTKGIIKNTVKGVASSPALRHDRAPCSSDDKFKGYP